MKKTQSAIALAAALLLAVPTLPVFAQEQAFEPAQSEQPSAFEEQESSLESTEAESELRIVQIQRASDLESLKSGDVGVIEAMNISFEITDLFRTAAAKAAAEDFTLIAVVHSTQGAYNQQGLLPAAELALSLDKEAQAHVIPAVILDSESIHTGPKFVMDFLEMYESVTGVYGYAIAEPSIADRSDWTGLKSEGILYPSIDTLCAMLSSEEVAQKLAVPAGKDEAQFLYRFYNKNTGEHFYTVNPKEAGVLLNAGWNYESLGWTAPSQGDPIYRLYNPNDGGDHHYTTDLHEAQYLVQAGWKDEGVAFNTEQADGKPVYRLYNKNARVNNHHFTLNDHERAALVNAGWKDEGIAFYAAQDVVTGRPIKGDNYFDGNIGYSPNQSRLHGLNRVNGRPYLFDENGEMIRTQGIYDAGNGRSVFVQFDGTLAESGLISWQGKVYYFGKDCFMTKNANVRISNLTYHFNGSGFWDNQTDVDIERMCNDVYAKVGKDP